MKVTGKQTVVQSVKVEINQDEIDRIIKEQDIDVITKNLQTALMDKFVNSLEPSFNGKRMVRQSFYSEKKGKLVLVHIDADWDYHNNVGEDEEVRVLTDEETVKYKMISGIPLYIESLEK